MEVGFDKLLTSKWTKLPYWWGNKDLGYDCWGKKYKTVGYNVVYIFGKEGIGKNNPCYDYTERNPDGTYNVSTRYIKEYIDCSDWHFCLRHSHSGRLPIHIGDTPEELMKYLDLRFKLGLLDHGRCLTEKELSKL